MLKFVVHFGFANQRAKKSQIWLLVCCVHYLVVTSAQYRWRRSAKLCCEWIIVAGGRTEINMNYHHNLHCTPLWCRYIWIISAQNLILLGQKDYSNLHSTNMYSTSLLRSTYDLWCSTYSQHNYFLYPLKFSAPASKKLVCVRSGAILWQGISAICMQRLPRRAKKWAKTCEKWHIHDFVQTKLTNLESKSFCHVLTIFRSALNTHADVAAVLDDELEHCWSQSHKTRTARSGTQKTFLIN